ncbi:hypothetical protein GUITHDRAFT_122141 [Guillardia theta CCMP2712]|uniref:Uncharacterized protein n=1 Tax=Guillardia theta (strain CCMP2712) TaxID=905079 RepID=L1I5Y3_GUITC|nr:hypothetical protein GUITHDRAFT_122141 [Guillardia theta CCMP2712]EKX31678.1 hypothetical protein GUITHDRAFT_122141 [Guillardia theta CCMP2712]|eukprot:XP_005818658.1 hypothetical protein GUITHDRAFT_122141 [Guillardia theta CCMP2712]
MLPKSLIGVAGLAALEEGTIHSAPLLRGIKKKQWTFPNSRARAYRLPSGASVIALEFNPTPLDFSLATVRQAFKDLLRYMGTLDRDQTLILTGWEFAAVLAQLLALFVPRHPGFELIAFGKPCPGNRSFARWYNSMLPFQFSFHAQGDSLGQYCRDLVPRSDPDSLWEDKPHVFLDNAEQIFPAAGDDLTHHDRNYYRRCCYSLHRCRSTVPPREPSLLKRSASRILKRFFRGVVADRGLIANARRFKASGIMDPSSSLTDDQIVTRLRQQPLIDCARRLFIALQYIIRAAQVKCGPDAAQVKCEPDAAQVKCGPDAAQVKCEPDAAQVKCGPDAAQVKCGPDAAQVKCEPDAAQVKCGPDGDRAAKRPRQHDRQQRQQDQDTQEPWNIRVVLSITLIHLNPNVCFEYIQRHQTQPQQELRNSAAEAFLALQDFISEATAPGYILDAHGLLRHARLPAKINAYIRAFKRWKVPDEQKITARIQHSLLGIYSAELRIPRGHPDFQAQQLEFALQKTKLWEKYAQLNSPEGALQLQESLRKDGFVVDLQQDADIVAGARMTTPAEEATIRPPRLTDTQMSNEQIAYELFLDPAFKIPDSHDPNARDVHSTVRVAFRNAFWESLAVDLQMNPPVYARVVNVFAEIVQGYLEIRPSDTALVRQNVNLPYITAQIEAATFQWQDIIAYLQFIFSNLLKIEPTVLRQEGSQWQDIVHGFGGSQARDQPGIATRALRLMLDSLQKLRLHIANSRLSRIAHVIAAHGVEYLKAHHKKFAAANPERIAQDRAWLLSAASRLPAIDTQALRDGSPQHSPPCSTTQYSPSSPPTSTSTFQLHFLMDRIAVAAVALADFKLSRARDVSPQQRSQAVIAVADTLNTLDIAQRIDIHSVWIITLQALLPTVLQHLQNTLPKNAIQLLQDPQEPGSLEAFFQIPEAFWNVTQDAVYNRWLEIIAHEKKPPAVIPAALKMPTRPVYPRILRNARALWSVVDAKRKIHASDVNEALANASPQ